MRSRNPARIVRADGAAVKSYEETGDEAAIKDVEAKNRIYRTHASTTRARPEKQNQGKSKKPSDRVDFISS
jgi:hypothetical protein